MRLLYKATLLFLLITAVVFSVGGIITYNIFEREVRLETERYLLERLWAMINNYNHGDDHAFTDAKVNIDTLWEKPEVIGRESIIFSDTVVMHPQLRRMETNRKLTVVEKLSDHYLRLSIHDVIVESDDLYEGAFLAQTRLFTILGIVMVLSSFFVSRWLFKPFDKTLESIRNFSIKDLKGLKLKKSTTKEFNLLNTFIERMTQQVSDDYRSLKEFTENASHEFQTPLAIAKGKLELLLQHSDLKDDQLPLIESSYQAINHLSKVGHSLALLTRIENREYDNFKEVEVKKMVIQVIESFRELIMLKNISLEQDLKNELVIRNDPTLIRVLFNNLLQNAVRYNREEGAINIRIDKNRFEISNTGDKLSTPAKQLFDRFKKDQQSTGSTGLGLAIVKKICDIGGYEIRYAYQDGWHSVVVEFTSSLKSDHSSD